MTVVDPDVTRMKLERELELWHENEETYRRRGWILLGRNELEIDIGFLGRGDFGQTSRNGVRLRTPRLSSAVTRSWAGTGR